MNLKSQLLIALPDMQDPRFKKAVILVCEHNENGSMGLVINHRMKDINTNQVFEELGLQQHQNNHPVFDGGPMKKSTGFVLHNDNTKFNSSVPILDKLTLTTSKDLLENISKKQFDNHWQFILGYSEWSNGQLESEIAQNTWLTCPANLELIFQTNADLKWQKALSLIGINDYTNISCAAHA